MKMSQNENDDDEEDEDIANLNSEVYDENNEIKLENIENQNETNFYNNISYGISNLTETSLNIINCTDNFTDQSINDKIYNYFDNFSYIIYNPNNEKNKKILESNSYKSQEKNNKRQLTEDNSFYGYKNFKYVKYLYKYNLIGLKMEAQIYSEIIPSSGKSISYFVIVFGNINNKLKLKDQYSNLNIIIEKENQMGYNLLVLLRQSNNDLIERNKHYADIIIDLEQNITEYFKKDYDYSFIFRDLLNNMYQQVQNFTGDFFYELIRLINNVFENYTILLRNIELEKYEVIIQIRKITKEEYINYIYNMVELLEIFENNTLTFLEDIENELDKINNFQIDVLYDIIDQINESKIIFKQFNKNLFKSIEKGIITFKYDINDYIDLIIGDLLYITDFLSVNIALSVFKDEKWSDFKIEKFQKYDIIYNRMFDDEY